MAPKTLVVPLDGSEYAERALPVAEAVAERIGGKVLLVSSQYQGPLEPRGYLEEVAALRVRCPIDIDVLPTEDTYPAAAICEIVDASDDRIVCMTTHGRGRLRWAALGSVAEEVIRRADGATLLVGRNCRSDFLERSTHLVVCADGDEESVELVPVVREWSAMLDLDLRLAVVMHPLDVDSAERADRLLGGLVAQFGGSDRATATMIRSRYVAGALADYADELPAALVGMNCHARTGLAPVALGSVTMAVLHLVSCPLLVTHYLP